jgi:multidrug resistance efflux pump
MSRRTLIILAVIVLALIGGVWFLTSGRLAGQAPSAPPTLGAVPESTTIAADVRVVPVHRAELAAPGSGGRVAEVLVAEGDTVTAGQGLLRLDTTRSEALLAQATAAKAAADANVRQAQAAARQAESQITVGQAGVDQAEAALRTADATRDAGPSGGAAGRAADSEVDRSRAALRSARATLAAARRGAEASDAAVLAATAEAERAQASVTEAQAVLDELTLGSPIAGIVASLDAVVGETIEPGAPVVRIGDTSAWRFETVDLDEAAIGRLADGATATVTVDAFADTEITARVTSISLFGETSAGDIVYTVTLEPTGDVPDGLRWNMTGSAQIEAGE